MHPILRIQRNIPCRAHRGTFPPSAKNPSHEAPIRTSTIASPPIHSSAVYISTILYAASGPPHPPTSQEPEDQERSEEDEDYHHHDGDDGAEGEAVVVFFMEDDNGVGAAGWVVGIAAAVADVRVCGGIEGLPAEKVEEGRGHGCEGVRLRGEEWWERFVRGWWGL